jgi:hypothetical protein
MRLYIYHMTEPRNVDAALGQMIHEKHGNAINILQTTAEIEKYLYNNMQKLQNKNNSNTVEGESIIKARINELKTMRIVLFQKLKNMYKESQQDTASNRQHLSDQYTVTSVLDDELQNIQQKLDDLKQDKNNKLRMVQLGDYEYDRYYSHKNIFKHIVYGTFIVLILVFLMKLPFFPKYLGVMGIIATISILIILISKTLYWNFRRDNINYDKFEQGDTSLFNDPKKPYVGKGSKGFWDRNSGSLNNLFSCENISKNVSKAKDDLGKVGVRVKAKVEGFKTMNNKQVAPSDPKNIDKLASIF